MTCETSATTVTLFPQTTATPVVIVTACDCDACKVREDAAREQGLSIVQQMELDDNSQYLAPKFEQTNRRPPWERRLDGRRWR